MNKIIQQLLDLLNIHVNKDVKKDKNKKNTTLVGVNLEKTYGKPDSYKCWVQNMDGDKLKNVHINITVAGKTYTKLSDDSGVVSLNINLNPGEYIVNTEYKGNDKYNGCKIVNYIKVNKAVTTSTPNTSKKNTTPSTSKTTTFKPNSKGEYWNPRYLSNGEEKQSTGYYCADVSIMQCVYELYGRDLSQRQIAQWAGTTTSGTGHSGINQALNTINKKYGYKMKYEWKNFSDVGWNKLAQICKDPNKTFIMHHMWHSFDGSDSGGHYTTFACICPSGKYCYEIYSLRGASLIKRSFSYMEKCMREISQPSICIISKS